MFRIFVFTTKQPEGSFGCCPCHNLRLIHSNARQNAQAMTALRKNIRLGIHKIFCTQNMNILHSSNLIYIVETGINNCNRHSLTFETCFMQFISIAQLNLSDGMPIDTIRMQDRLIDYRIPFR